MTQDEKEGLVQVFKALAPHVLEDAVSKDVRAGYLDGPTKALRSIMDVSSAMVQAPFWTAQQGMNWVKDVLGTKIEYIPKAERQLPAPNIAIPALESLRSRIHIPELCEMFANLVASSMDRRMEAHPAYVEVISQMTAEEARVVSHIGRTLENRPSVVALMRIVEYNLHGSPLGSPYTFSKIKDHYCHLSVSDAGVHRIDKPDIFDNLERLKLIDTQYEDPYRVYKNPMWQKSDLHNELKRDLEEIARQDNIKPAHDGEILYVKGYLTMTMFGERFVNSCVHPGIAPPSSYRSPSP